MSDTESAIRAMAATVAFLKAEGDLLRLNTNERSITHKLAEYLQRDITDWNVDCEYNRLGTAIKRLPAPEAIGSDDEDGRTIFPDIIVHRRNKRENLLVIEVKKSSNTRGGDEEKLIGLTRDSGDYGYTTGLHLIFDCESCRLSGLTAYANGAVDEGLSTSLRAKYL